MDITPLIMTDPYQYDFHKMLWQHQKQLERYFLDPAHTQVELSFQIDDHVRLGVYMDNIDTMDILPFIAEAVPADFVFIEIDNLKVPSRKQLRLQLLRSYGLDPSIFDSLVDMKDNPIYELVYLTERAFLDKKYLHREVPIPAHSNPLYYSRDSYYLTLYREDVFELYKRLRVLIETLS